MAITKSAKTTILATYPDHTAAENAVKMLQKDGLPMKQLSIVGSDFQTIEKPVGFVTSATVAKDGAKIGAWTGGIFGLLLGAAFLILPGVGPVIIAGPLSAALLGGAEGAVAGAAFGGLTGALVGMGVPKASALRYESQLKAGKYLVMFEGDASSIERAKGVMSSTHAESTEVAEAPAN